MSITVQQRGKQVLIVAIVLFGGLALRFAFLFGWSLGHQSGEVELANVHISRLSQVELKPEAIAAHSQEPSGVGTDVCGDVPRHNSSHTDLIRCVCACIRLQ